MEKMREEIRRGRKSEVAGGGGNRFCSRHVTMTNIRIEYMYASSPSVIKRRLDSTMQVDCKIYIGKTNRDESFNKFC